MHRRDFLAIAGMTCGATALGYSQTPPTVSVVDFGADSSGHKDATVAIQNALSKLVSTDARRLLFPHGVYRISSAQHIAFLLSGHSGLEIEGSGSTLLMGSDAVCLAFDKCSDVTVRNLTIDLDPLPYTQGAVAASGLGWFEVEVDSGFPVPPRASLLGVATYDRSSKGVTGEVIEIPGASVSAVRMMNGSRLRVNLTSVRSLPVGTIVVLRLRGDHDAVRLTNCRDLSFDGMRVLTSYMFGYNISYCSNLAFSQCAIEMPSGSLRLLSTNADGMHVMECSGNLTFDQCVFQGMGDDCLNVGNALWRTEVAPNGTPVFSHANANAPAPGDRLEVLEADDLRVISTAPTPLPKTAAVTPSMPRGALVDDLNRIPATTVSNCHFLGNRGRGIIADANVQIRNSVFRNTSLAAILAAPDSYWLEGPATQYVVIDSNSFAGCHYTYRDPEGTITVDLQQTYGRRGPVPAGIAKNVQITNNDFQECYTAAVSCRSVDGLVIEKNRIGRTWVRGGTHAGQAILLSELLNSTIVGNTSSAPNHIVLQDCQSTKLSGNEGFS